MSNSESSTSPEPASEAELTAEQMMAAEQMAKDMADARSRLLETEAATIITNHALGLYELAAIHIASEDPNLDEARLAIDALGALVDGLSGRLGDGEETLIEALSNIKMVYVRRVSELKSAQEAPAAEEAAPAED